MGTKGRVVLRWPRSADDAGMAGRIRKAYFIRCDAGMWVETLYTTPPGNWPQLIKQLLDDATIEEEVDPVEGDAAACWPFIEYEISAEQADDATIVYVGHPTEVVLDLKPGEDAPTPMPLHPAVRKVHTFRPQAEPPAKKRRAEPTCQFCSHVGKFRRISNTGGGARCQGCQATVRCMECNAHRIDEEGEDWCNQCLATHD